MRISDWSSDVCSSDLSSPRSSRASPLPPSHRTIRVTRCLPHKHLPRLNAKWRPHATALWAIRCLRERVGPQRILASLPTLRSEEHTSELQSLMRISYAVFCLKKKKEIQPKLYH